MAQIGTFNNNGTFNDNSVTIAQTNISPAEPHTAAPIPSATPDHSIARSPNISKIDLIRIIYTMQEYGFFVKPGTATQAGIKDVLDAFSKMLNDPSLHYEKAKKDIDTAKNASDETNSKIFNQLAEISVRIFD